MRNLVSVFIGLSLCTLMSACGGETEQKTQAPSEAGASRTAEAPAADQPPAQAQPKATPPSAETPEVPEPKVVKTAPAQIEQTVSQTSADETAAATSGTVHDVRMLNADPDNPQQKMIYIPQILRIAPGDTVRFLPSSPGHNSASTRGMTPDGFEGWKSKINKTFEVTLSAPGIYGYNCTPHKATGMVGLIIVEGDGMLDNLEDAKAVRQVGKAKGVWADIWSTAAASGALTP